MQWQLGMFQHLIIIIQTYRAVPSLLWLDNNFKNCLRSNLFRGNFLQETKGAFHLSELTGQTISVAMIISLSIKTLQPDQSNPKYYARRRWFFSENSSQKPISFSNCLVGLWPARPVLTNGKRPKFVEGKKKRKEWPGGANSRNNSIGNACYAG